MTDLRTLVPKGEEVWVTYYRKDELLFFLTGPAGLSSTLTAKQGSFKLYSVTAGKKGALTTKLLGSGGNPKELEERYKIYDAISAAAIKKAS